MRQITFDQLLSKIDNYADGINCQSRPEIIWLENVESEIASIAPHSDAPGLAAALAAKDDRIAFYEKAGSPLTDHKHRYHENGNIVSVSSDERYSFCLPCPPIKIDNDGQLYTRVFIHSPYICYIGEDGLTSLEYGIILHEKLDIPVLLMYPYRWRERIISKGDVSEYEEILCRKPIHELKND